MTNALVTGGAGFIGSNLVRALVERGDEVRVLDNFSTGNRANLAGVEVDVVEGELRSYERVHNAVREIEVVYHLGALGSVPRSVQDPLTSNAVNVEGTLNVLLAARDSGVRRVVFASSSSVYGSGASLPVTEETPPDPISPYGVAKLAAERYCVAFSRVYDGLETVVLRYFNVFGPRQSPYSQYAAMVPLFLTAVMRGEPITIDGDGEQSRGFTYVANAVDATLRAADVEAANGRIFNVSGAAPATVNEVADAIGRILGKPVERRHGPPRVGDIRASWADVTAAREALGWEPTVGLDEGLRLTAQYLEQQLLAEPVRVLRLVARLNMGGPALHVSYLTKGLEERGYETTLAAGTIGRGEGSMSFVAEELGVEVHPIPQLHRDISPLYDTQSVTSVVRLIRRVRPHILHTHTAKAGAIGRFAALASGDARPPIVVHTFHGHVLRGYFDPARTAAFRTIERRLARSTTRLVAVSPEVRDDLVELGVAAPERFSVIRLGIPLDSRVTGTAEDRARLRALFGVPADRFVVGWIGRMTAIKRVEDVLLAFRELLGRGVDATLVLVGDGPDRDGLERRAHELGIARQLLSVGYQREVAPYYAFMDALLLPSANEGTPVVAIEALAARRPVVATRVGGVPDVVEEGEDGFLVPVGDVGAMAAALERLARDPELRAQMGEHGAERVIPRYRVERLVDDVDALYRELLANAGLPLPG